MSAPIKNNYDLIVIGAGAAGLATAVSAAVQGARVLVLEKTETVGGTGAWSGGWMWVPRNPLARAAGIDEPVDHALNYLREVVGPRLDMARAERYLELAPKMVEFFQSKTALRFIDGNAIPDFYGEMPHAATGGRSVCAAPFDGRQLGDNIKQLRPPLDIVSFLGMGIAAGPDMRHFMNAMRSWRSFKHVTRRVGKHLWHLVRYGQGMQLVAGNALVARLFKSALNAKVEFRCGVEVKCLKHEAGRVTGVVIASQMGEAEINASNVALACGGFPHDAARAAALLPQAAHYSAAPPSNTGDGLRLGEAVGAVVDASLAQAAAWAPVSLVPRIDSSVGHFPHLIERGKPGLIAVRANGRRFVNEANPYYDFMCALIGATPQGEELAAWLIVDHRFLRRYGLGAVKPSPIPIGTHLRSGYLKRGDTLPELALMCGIDAEALVSTIKRFNAAAEMGEDHDFGRGDTPYNRMQGDAEHKPNPCVAQIVQAPFYAVKIVAGSLGTFAGLKVNSEAQALNAHDAMIPGLYVVGNDMSSVMGGYYPSGGITLGPALTFGYWVGCQVASGR